MLHLGKRATLTLVYGNSTQRKKRTLRKKMYASGAVKGKGGGCTTAGEPFSVGASSTLVAGYEPPRDQRGTTGKPLTTRREINRR